MDSVKLDVESTSSETIHVVLSIWDLTDTYNRHVGVTMVSVLENTSHSVHFHLLYDEERSKVNPKLAERNRSRYHELADKYGVEVDFYHVSVPDSVKKLPFVKVYTEGALLRFYIPDLFKQYEKIIYLDTDIIVRKDIHDLWNKNISQYSLAAVNSKLSKSYIRKYRKVGINPDNYFNSGVLFFNLERIQAENTTANDYFTMLVNNPGFEWPDQDVLNKYYSESVLLLSDDYNKFTGLREKKDYDNMILHFAGRVKPWNLYQGGADKYYWKYLTLTPWGNDVCEIVPFLLEAPNIEKSLNMTPKWLGQMWPKEQLQNIWRLSIQIPLKAFLFDIKYLILHRLLGKNSV